MVDYDANNLISQLPLEYIKQPFNQHPLNRNLVSGFASSSGTISMSLRHPHRQLFSSDDEGGIGQQADYIDYAQYSEEIVSGVVLNGSAGEDIITSTFMPSIEQVSRAVVQHVSVKLHNNGTIVGGGMHSNSSLANSVVTATATASASTGSTANVFESQIIIPMYATIFLLSVIGNTLVLITLIQNKRMRTVTNVYLLNLALSDLLLGVFCMPFTLVGQVLRNFIFGAAMCKLIPYFQAVAISVGVWTLVAISLERYFAICRPLKSRRWQTQFHAYKMIVMVWLASLCWSAPVLLVSQLQSMKGRSGFKCREEWPTRSSEQAYNLFLDAMLLLVPLLFMGMAYSLIMSKLWKGLQREIKHNTCCRQQMFERSNSASAMNALLLKNNNTSVGAVNGPAKSQSASYSSISDKTIMVHHQANDTTQEKDKQSSDNVESVTVWILNGITKLCNAKPTTTLGPLFKNPYRSKITTPHSTAPAPSHNHQHHHNQYASASSDSRNTTTTTNLTYSGQYTTGTTVCSTNTVVDANDRAAEENRKEETTYTFGRHTRHAIRSNYMEKSIEAKRKVIRMLFVVVAEFFICWAPLHILNTCYLFYPEAVYRHVGSTGISLIQLLAYISSCCNPITYCFMNRKFRQAFIAIFNCRRLCCCFFHEKSHQVQCNLQKNGINKIVVNNSESGNDSTIYVGRASTIGRSEVLVLEAEDRV